MYRLLSLIAAVVAGAALVAATAVVAAPAPSDSDICFKQSGDVAIAACTRAIRSGRFKGTALGTLYHNRAVEYELKQDYDKALADYNAALKLFPYPSPDRPDALVGRGNCYSAKGDQERAIKDYDDALRQDLGNVNGYYNRGLAYRRKGDVQRARADYEKAISLPARNDSDRGAQAKARNELAALPAS
jgi:tetratricopeptide (TPR) repeat protein